MSLLKNIFSKPVIEDSVKDSPKELKIEGDIPGEIVVAIATGIFLYKQEVHDIEEAVLTIKRIDKIYSPWSSREYGITEWPNKN